MHGSGDEFCFQDLLYFPFFASIPPPPFKKAWAFKEYLVPCLLVEVKEMVLENNVFKNRNNDFSSPESLELTPIFYCLPFVNFMSFACMLNQFCQI